ncbi:MAG: guanylate kinase [Bdellovibrionota bacterium]
MKIKRPPICFVISSPSGAGKTTLVEAILKKEEKLEKTISHTTRKKRPDEKNGEHYHFVDTKTFQQIEKSGQMLEWASVYEHQYGTSKKEIDRIMNKGHDVILVIENQGAMNIKRLYPRSVFVLILPPSLKELERRILKRKHGDEDVERRLKNATREMRNMIWYDYVIVNDDVDEAVELLQNIIHAERAKLPPIKTEVFKPFLD